MASLAQYLDLIRPFLPEDLVSAQAYRDIHRIAEGIPGALAFSAHGFECRLGVPEASADLLFSLQTDNSGPDILAGKLLDSDFAASLVEAPGWTSIRDFGRLWTDPPSALLNRIDDVWLELDVHDSPDGPLPSLFFCPLRRGESVVSIGLDEVSTLLEDVYARTTGYRASPVMIRRCRSCLAALPRMRSLFQVGIMLNRPGENGLRCCVSLPSPQASMDYLARVGWPGDRSVLGAMMHRLASWFGPLALHLQVSDELSPKIGIECGFAHRRAPDREPRWHGFLDLLVDQGLCLAKKRDALLAFPGYAPTDPGRCPVPLQRLATRLELLYRSFFVRSIYHVKLVLDAGGGWQAKAYLGINHIWKGLDGHYEKGRGRWGLIE